MRARGLAAAVAAAVVAAVTALAAPVAAVAAPAPIAAAGPGRPAALAGVGVDERVGNSIPLDLWFTDTAGRRVRLGDLFDGKPVLLVLAYVRCKMLCSLVLRGAGDAVRAMPLALGRDYRVITISIDPREDSASAAARRGELLRRLGLPDDAAWSYLVGAERPIRALADSLGFRFAWDPRTEQYAHPAVVFVLTPDGTISRYLHGVTYEPARVAEALRAAAAGELAPSAAAEAVLDCFRFDPAARAHRDQIEAYLRIGAAAVILALGSTIGLLFLWERRRRRRS